MEAQHMQALAKANEKKSARAALKRRVYDGEIPISVVIASKSDLLKTSSSSQPLTIAKILAWQKNWGKARAKRFLHGLGISEQLELDGLSESRRKMLAKRLL